MDLSGQAVKHKVFGKGVITGFCDNKITVCFAIGEKMFLFPDAIPKYLTLRNMSIQNEIEDMNKKLEQERLKKKKQQEKKNEYRSRLYTMKIIPKSQVAFNVTQNDNVDLTYVETGHYLSGSMRGKPRIPANIQPNSAVILTECDSDNEENRIITGVAMVDDKFWGKSCSDGRVALHTEYRVMLPPDIQVLFWKYFNPGEGSSRWGNIPFKYFQTRTMEKILYDICRYTHGTELEDKSADMYSYFCKLNRIAERYEKPEIQEEMYDA